MQTDPRNVRYLQLNCRALNCEVRVNDVPVTWAQEDQAKSSAMPIRQYMLRGDNRLEVLLGSQGAAVQRGGYSAMAQISVRVADFWEDEDLAPDGGVAQASLAPTIGPDTPNPTRGGTSFPSLLGEDWAWTTAPRLDPIAARPQIDTAMNAIAMAFAAQDVGALLPLQEPAIRDRALAYPVTTIDSQIMMFRTMFSQVNPDQWRPIPFDPARARYDLVADGRMIRPVDPEGLPLIRSESLTPDAPYEDPNYRALTGCLGVHNGQLKFMTI